MKIEFVQTHKDAELPKRNHDHNLFGDAGYDLFAVETVIIEAGKSAVIPIGLKLGYMTPGFWFRIEARSGLGFKKSLQPHFGIIDNPYRGDLGIKIYNFSEEDQVIVKGNACAQMIVYAMISADMEFVDNVSESERGSKGFGSSDKN
jgi:dUTP pyrophosphatase